MIADMVLALGTTSFTPREFILSETDRMGVVFHIIMSAHDLYVVMMVVKVVWILGTPTLPPRELIVVLMLVILFHLIVGNIHP